MVRAKKHLGQHFLKDASVAERIAQAIDGETGNVLEVGPGTGILTKSLILRDFQNLKLIELDSESVEYLQQNFFKSAFELIEGDFLKLNLLDMFGGNSFSLTGNFPYNISSQILFRIFENREIIPEMVGMFQKEVAERVAANEGSKTYGILSVLLKVYYKVDYMFTVDAHLFNPPPKVQSAVIKLKRNNRTELPFPDKKFKSVVKMAFNQRRKTLRNALSAMIPENPSETIQKYLPKRAEQLSPDEFIELATELIKAEKDRA
jgi:16S rRNA (adenine1518-N6/adenine1519-N6)-dimethyltransferase